MFQFFLFELFASMLILFAAKKEYDLILDNVNKKCELSTKITNADLIYASIITIFENKWGELKAFLYPIVLSLVAIVTYWQLKLIDGEVSKWVIIYLGVVVFIVTLHIVIPYYFTYIKYYEGSLNRKLDFIKFLNFSTEAFYKTDDLGKIDNIDIDSFRESIKEYFTADDLEKYNKILSFLPEDKYRTLTKEEFERALPHLNGHNIYFIEKDTDKYCDFWLGSESNDVEISRVVVGCTQMGMALFHKTTIGSLLNQRYLDIVAFFMFLNLVLYFSK